MRPFSWFVLMFEKPVRSRDVREKKTGIDLHCGKGWFCPKCSQSITQMLRIERMSTFGKPQRSAQCIVQGRLWADGRPSPHFPYRAVPRGIEKGAMANGPLGRWSWCRVGWKVDIPRVRRTEQSEVRCGLPWCCELIQEIGLAVAAKTRLEYRCCCFRSASEAIQWPLGTGSMCQ